jgi:hypothetical protein
LLSEYSTRCGWFLPRERIGGYYSDGLFFDDEGELGLFCVWLEEKQTDNILNNCTKKWKICAEIMFF